METVKGDNKVMLLEAFTKDTGIRLGIETRREYTWWLEQQVVKNLAIPVVSDAVCHNTNCNFCTDHECTMYADRMKECIYRQTDC